MVTTAVLIRHAKAQEGDYEDDQTRPLAEEGREQQKLGALFLQEKKLVPDHIFCSPYLRAEESADILKDVFHSPVTTDKALGSEFDGHHLLKLVEPGKTTFFVGHEPTLSTFANRLVGHPCLPTGLSKGAAIVITFDGAIDYNAATFVAYIPPPPK